MQTNTPDSQETHNVLPANKDRLNAGNNHGSQPAYGIRSQVDIGIIFSLGNMGKNDTNDEAAGGNHFIVLHTLGEFGEKYASIPSVIIRDNNNHNIKPRRLRIDYPEQCNK